MLILYFLIFLRLFCPWLKSFTKNFKSISWFNLKVKSCFGCGLIKMVRGLKNMIFATITNFLNCTASMTRPAGSNTVTSLCQTLVIRIINWRLLVSIILKPIFIFASRNLHRKITQVNRSFDCDRVSRLFYKITDL